MPTRHQQAADESLHSSAGQLPHSRQLLGNVYLMVPCDIMGGSSQGAQQHKQGQGRPCL